MQIKVLLRIYTCPWSGNTWFRKCCELQSLHLNVFLLHAGHSILSRYCSFHFFAAVALFQEQITHGISAMAMASIYSVPSLYWLLWWHCRFVDLPLAGPQEGLKIWGCQYYLVGIISPPLVEIGLTDLPWHPRHPQGRHPCLGLLLRPEIKIDCIIQGSRNAPPDMPI